MGELQQINHQIDATETQTLKMINTEMSSMVQIQTLGKLELFDRSLSVQKNEACSTCHMPSVGYTGASQTLNETTVAYPGSVMGRFSGRKPQSYSYATLAPVLHYNATQQDFYGGNFWDMRATGSRLQSASAEQAQGPPTNPVEMGLPDSACVAYRIDNRIDPVARQCRKGLLYACGRRWRWTTIESKLRGSHSRQHRIRPIRIVDCSV
jgi:cytochrome c peroxidase